MPKIVAMGSTSIVDVLDGNSVIETIIEYAISTDGKNPPGTPMTDGATVITDMNGVVLTEGTWSTEIPTITEGQWLWTRTRTFYSDGKFTIVYNVSRSGNDGSPGAPGIGYTAQKEQWYLSSSPIKLEGGSWSDNEPDEIPDGKYLWGRIEYTMSDGSTRYSDAIYRSMISGLVNKADEVEKKIEQKIWASDIENSINSYDGSTGKSIRDRVTKTETDISGINTSISNIQSNVSQKADGSTVTQLSERVNTISDTVGEHTQTISNNTSRIDNAEAEITSTKTTATQTAEKFTWLVESGDSASNFTLTDRAVELISSEVVIKDPGGNSTVITGGNVQANTITAAMLATDAIKSSNYSQSENPNTSPYSGSGTFLDLANGNFWTPNFGVIQDPLGTNVPTGAWFNGTVYATAGRFGDGSASFDIETFNDSSQNKYAGLVAEGNAYIETGNWQVSNNSVATRKYITTTESAGQLTYYRNSETGIYYDFGMKIPKYFDGIVASDNGEDIYNKSFFYGRKSKGNYIPVDDDGWDYLFQVDHEGNIYEHGYKLSDLYAPISGDAGSHYVMTKGNNTIDGNLTVTGTVTVTGTLTATADKANQLTHTLSINGVSFDGSGNSDVDVGTIGVAYGGTGKTEWTQWGIIYASATNALSQVGSGTSGQLLKSNGSAAPTWVNQSAITAGKATNDANGDQIDTTYRKISNTTFTTLTVSGSANFTSGLTGNVTGNVTGSAGSVENNLKIQLNGGTTEGTNQFTYNGSAEKTINITKSSIGLGNVQNVDLSTWTGSANLTTIKLGTLAAAATKGIDTALSSTVTNDKVPTSAAVVNYVDGKNYGILSIAESDSNGKLSVTTASGTSDISVHGLGSWAYKSSGSASDVGLGSVTNNKQIKGLSSGTTSGHLVSWGTDGYTVADSGVTTAGVKKTVTTLASNDDGKIVLTYLDGTTSDPIEVKIIGQSGSSVSYADALNVNGTAVGSLSKPVFINAQGKPQQANTIPTITLNESTTTSASFYAPTSAGNDKQYLMSNGSGVPTWQTFSASTVGLGLVENKADADRKVLSATKFTNAQSYELTGDTTGTVSSQIGWTMTTTTSATTPTKLTNENLNTLKTTKKSMFYYAEGNNTVTNRAGNTGSGFALNTSAIGGSLVSQELTTYVNNGITKKYIRHWDTSVWNSWQEFITSGNYTDYTVTKSGTGATGTWDISISGNAATATNATSAATATNADFLTNHTVDTTAIDNTAGTFSLDNTNGVGFQAGTSTNKWQIMTNNGTLQWRNNSSGGTNSADWTSWNTLLSSNNYSDYAVPKTGGEFTGTVTGTVIGASNYLAANSGNSSTAGGIALYSTKPMQYGIAMRAITNGGSHGYVWGGWAIYFNMSGSGDITSGANAANRGWIFRNHQTDSNVVSISGAGNAVFNGSVTVGGNAENNSGCRLVYSEDTQSLNFVFN